MPFLIERFVNFAKQPKQAACLPNGLLHELTRFFYDTAQASNPGAMSSLTQLVPASRILFGTDYPYRRASEYRGRLSECGFSPSEIGDIEQQNAERLLSGLS